MQNQKEILNPAISALVQAGADYDVVVSFIDAKLSHAEPRFIRWLVAASRARGVGVRGKFLTAAMSFSHPHADLYRTYLRRCGMEKPRSKNHARRIHRLGDSQTAIAHRSGSVDGVDRKWLKVDYTMIARVINLCNDTNYDAGKVKLIHRGAHAHTEPLRACIVAMVGEYREVGVACSLPLAYATPDYTAIAEAINQERGTNYDGSDMRRVHKGVKLQTLQPCVIDLVGRWDRWFDRV